MTTVKRRRRRVLPDMQPGDPDVHLEFDNDEGRRDLHVRLCRRSSLGLTILLPTQSRSPQVNWCPTLSDIPAALV